MGTAFSTYKFAVNGYTYAAGDKLVYDVYTDSDYDTQSRPTENDNSQWRESAARAAATFSGTASM